MPGDDKDKLKECLSKYKKEDFCKLSWEEFSRELDNLSKKVMDYVAKNNIKISAVVPILRGGNFPGTHLAYKLMVLRIIPVQYKYFFMGETCELKQILDFPEGIFSKGDSPIFLLVECNHCYGLTANTAAKDLKKKFPNCKIIYAASSMDYTYRNAVEDAEVSFYGRYTNDAKELSDEECKKLGIDDSKSYIYPWEDIEEEWSIIQMKQSPFVDLDEAIKNSKLCTSIDLENL